MPLYPATTRARYFRRAPARKARRYAPVRRFFRRPATRRVAAVAQQVRANTRMLRDTVQYDHYQLAGTSQLPQNGVYPYWYSVLDPLSWTRVFDVLGTTDLESKTKVRLLTMKTNLRFSLEGSSADESYIVHAFLVGLHRAGKVIFPTGMANGNFLVGTTHTSNDTNNQVMLNPQIFRTYKSWRFQLGSKADGTTTAVTTYGSSYRNFSFTMRMDKLLSSCIDSWKSMNSVDLPVTNQLYLMVFATSTDDKVTPLGNPQIQFQHTFTIRSAN